MNAAANVARAVIDAVLAAGRAIVDVVTAIAGAGLAAIRKVVGILFDLGRSLVDVLRSLAKIAFQTLKDVVKAAFELGKTIVEFTRSMVEFTYATAARFIQAALDAGAAVVDMLETVVDQRLLRAPQDHQRRAPGARPGRGHPRLADLPGRGADQRPVAPGGARDPLRQEQRHRGPRLGDGPGATPSSTPSCAPSRRSAPGSPTSSTGPLPPATQALEVLGRGDHPGRQQHRVRPLLPREGRPPAIAHVVKGAPGRRDGGGPRHGVGPRPGAADPGHRAWRRCSRPGSPSRR